MKNRITTAARGVAARNLDFNEKPRPLSSGRGCDVDATRQGRCYQFVTIFLLSLSLNRRKSLVFLSEGDGTRTRNHRIDSPVL